MTINTIKTMSNALVNYTAKALKCGATKEALTQQFKKDAEAFEKAYNSAKLLTQKEAEERKQKKAKELAEKAQKQAESRQQKEAEQKKEKEQKQKDSKKDNSKKEQKQKTDYSVIKADIEKAIKEALKNDDKVSFNATKTDIDKKHRFYVKYEGLKVSVRIQYTAKAFNVVSNTDFAKAVKTELAHPYRATQLTKAEAVKAVKTAIENSKKEQKQKEAEQKQKGAKNDK